MLPPTCLTICQPTLEPGAGLEPENSTKVPFPDKLIDRILSMLALRLGQNQPGRIAIVEATEVGLYLEWLLCAVECHLFRDWGIGVRGGAGEAPRLIVLRGTAARPLIPVPWPLSPNQILNVGSFFATAMFLSVTYTGRPFLYFG